MVVLGIDIGGAQIRAGMVDENGAIVASRTIATPSDLDAFLPLLHDAIRWLLEATAVPAGVGIGCKGIINPDSTQVETLPGTLHFLEGLRLADLVGLPLDVPVFADNAARVALAAELVWGARAEPSERRDADPRSGRRRARSLPAATCSAATPASPATSGTSRSTRLGRSAPAAIAAASKPSSRPAPSKAKDGPPCTAAAPLR